MTTHTDYRCSFSSAAQLQRAILAQYWTGYYKRIQDAHVVSLHMCSIFLAALYDTSAVTQCDEQLMHEREHITQYALTLRLSTAAMVVYTLCRVMRTWRCLCRCLLLAHCCQMFEILLHSISLRRTRSLPAMR
jgi:hypothetical protein